MEQQELGLPVKVESMTEPGKFYEVDPQKLTCSCPAFAKGMRPCKHLIELLGPEKFGKKTGVNENKKRSDAYRAEKSDINVTKELLRLKTELKTGMIAGIGPEDSPETIEKTLLERLGDALSGHQFDPEGVSLKDDKRRWIASSGLQKAVRRGKPATSRRIAEAMVATVAWYIGRRLQVILTEDIGVADLGLVAQYVLARKQPKEWWQKMGGMKKVVDFFVEKAAKGLKDRTACDVLNVTGLPKYSKLMEIAKVTPTPKLIAQIMGDEWDTIEKMTGLLGYAQRLTDKKEKWPTIAVTLMSSETPALVKWVTIESLKSQGEIMPISYPFLWEVMKATTRLKAVKDAEPSLGMVGPFPSEAYDQHTQDGKRAFAYYSKVIGFGDWVHENAAVQNTTQVMGAVVFWLEGQRVDRRLGYDYAEEALKPLTKYSFSNWATGGNEQTDKAVEMIWQEKEKLHQARLRTASI